MTTMGAGQVRLSLHPNTTWARKSGSRLREVTAMSAIYPSPDHDRASLELNRQGDRLVSTTGKHGADISLQRLDALDRASLQFALASTSNTRCAVDLGCGLGAHSLRLALLGYEVTLIDLLDRSEFCITANGLLHRQALRLVRKDARQVSDLDLPVVVELLYSQRFLHYLRFEEARLVLERIVRRMPPGTKAFLSASGIHSELGEGYPHHQVAVEQRYERLATPMADKHQIYEPVCLYELDDLARLAHRLGLTVERLFASEFGNVKGIFSV